MPVKLQNGTFFFVPKKTRASKKNQGASESVRKRDKNDPAKDESHIHARTHDMTTGASNTKSRAYSTKPGASYIHPTESSMPCVETKASPIETNASPIETKACFTEPKPPPTESEAPSTSPIESSMPCVETKKLVVTIYFASREFKIDMIEGLLQRRACETSDPDIFSKANSVIIEAELYEEGGWHLDRVDEWLNKQMSYKDLLSLTKIDDWIKQGLQESVNALVLYARSINLPNIRAEALINTRICR